MRDTEILTYAEMSCRRKVLPWYLRHIPSLAVAVILRYEALFKRKNKLPSGIKRLLGESGYAPSKTGLAFAAVAAAYLLQLFLGTQMCRTGIMGCGMGGFNVVFPLHVFLMAIMQNVHFISFPLLYALSFVLYVLICYDIGSSLGKLGDDIAALIFRIFSGQNKSPQAARRLVGTRSIATSNKQLITSNSTNS